MPQGPTVSTRSSGPLGDTAQPLDRMRQRSAAPANRQHLSCLLRLSVRQRAAWALGKIGPPACDALDALRQAAASSNPRLAMARPAGGGPTRRLAYRYRARRV